MSSLGYFYLGVICEYGALHLCIYFIFLVFTFIGGEFEQLLTIILQSGPELGWDLFLMFCYDCGDVILDVGSWKNWINLII